MEAWRRVVIVLYEGFQLLDLAGPADVFGMAGLCSGGAGYEVELTAVDAEAVMAHNGVTVTVPSAIGRIERPVDTLVVAGGLTAVEATRDERLVAGIERLAGDARRVASARDIRTCGSTPTRSTSTTARCGRPRE